MGLSITSMHTWSMGHSITGHCDAEGKPGKCSRLHGHTYTVEVEVDRGRRVGEILDSLGMVIDFDVIKREMFKIIEDKWDHRLMIWNQDARSKKLEEIDPAGTVVVDYNPTSENLAMNLMIVFRRTIDKYPELTLLRVRVWESPKTYAEIS